LASPDPEEVDGLLLVGLPAAAAAAANLNDAPNQPNHELPARV